MATLVRWEPFRELATLQTEMSRLMNGLSGGDNGRETRSWVPALDAWETEDEVVYAFDLPGVTEDKVSIELSDDALTVSATREREDRRSEEGYYRLERRFGSFSRTVAVPQGVTEDGIEASFADGVLEIRVAKPAQRKPRRIQLGGGKQKTIEGSAAKSSKS